MTKPTKYIARHAGKIVGTRKSHRHYAFAIVTQRIESVHHERAYGYQATATDRSNFDYDTFVSRQVADAPCTPPGWRLETKYNAQSIADAQALVAGGFDAFVGRVRARHISRFEDAKAKGSFEPMAVAWSSNRTLAEKAVKQHTGEGVKLLAIVPAEVA